MRIIFDLIATRAAHAASELRAIHAHAARYPSRCSLTLVLAASLLAAAHPARAQSLASRVSSVGDGTVQLRFASRSGVCGDGRGSIGSSGHSFTLRRSSDSDFGYDDTWCAPGPVRVVLSVHDGEVERARVFVGGNDSSSGVRDLGTVGAHEAAGYFLALAPRAPARVADDAIVAAVLADSVTPWPALLSIARDGGVPRGTRQSATFWLSRGAAAVVNQRSLFGAREEDESERDEVRGAAIFALSQQPRDEGVPALIRVARGSNAPAARDKALFWLGQSGDSRALDLFAQILGAN